LPIPGGLPALQYTLGDHRTSQSADFSELLMAPGPGVLSNQGRIFSQFPCCFSTGTNKQNAESP